LGSRVVAMLLDGRPRAGESAVNAVSEALLDHLLEAGNSLGLHGTPLTGEDDLEYPAFTSIRFVRGADQRRMPIVSCAVGAPGWSVLLSSRDVPSSIRGGPFRRLGRIVAVLLHALCPKAGINEARTIIVDDQFGREMPTTMAELVDACVRLGVER